MFSYMNTSVCMQSTCSVQTLGHEDLLMLLNISMCTKLTLFPHLDELLLF